MVDEELISKHDQIIKHIEAMEVGKRLSVRKIAKVLDVSDGTAYRAIKEAENLGLVSTKGRTGTVRVQRKETVQFDKLTFAEIVNMVNGKVLGGSAGLNKTLNKFVIGAMQLDAMLRYVEAGNLLIVGNRTQAHFNALRQGAGVLITGGFETTPQVTELADEMELPVISCSYDSFSVATLINRAIDDRLIKKKILLVGDIMSTDTPVVSLQEDETVKSMRELVEESRHTRFPVLDHEGKPVGVITTKDIITSDAETLVKQVMTSNPHTITTQTSAAGAAHTMVWEGIELLPVVDSDQRMIGVITRKDVLKAMQDIQTQPQNGETFEDLIWSGFKDRRDENGNLTFHGIVTPQMTNYIGMISEGVLVTLMMRAAYHTVKELKRGDLMLDSNSNYFLVPVQIDDSIEIIPNIIELSRRFCKIDIEIFSNEKRIARSMFTARLINNNS